MTSLIDLKKLAFTNTLFLALLSLAPLAFPKTVFAEEEEQKVRVTELQVSNSPVLNLLGVAPSEIEAPKFPRAFGFVIPKSLSSSDGAFPATYAVEVGPYWWFSHPDLTFDDYYDKNGFGESILQSLSFSIGTTQEKMMVEEEEVEVTKIGAGFKTSLLAGNKHPQFEEKEQELTDSFSNCINTNFKDDCIQESRKKVIELESLGQDRVGWKLDLANAYTFNSEDENFDELDLAQIGVWFTASYRPTVHDEVIERVTNDECQARINSLFNSYDLTFASSFTKDEIKTASKRYDCVKYPDTKTKKIAFFDKLDQENLDEADKKCESSENDMCLKQSGLSVLRVVDKINLEDSIDASDNSPLAKCKWGLKTQQVEFTPPGGSTVSLVNVIPLIAAQQDHFDTMQELDDNSNNDVVFSNQPNDSDINKYECRTLNKSGKVEAFIINKDSILTSLEGESEEVKTCNSTIDNFISKNELPQEDEGKYTCAEFALPDLVLKIPNPTIQDIDEKCENKIIDKKLPKPKDEDTEEVIEAKVKKLKSVYKCTNKPSNITFLGIGRYINNQGGSGLDGDNYDVGASVNWQPSADSKLLLSGEYIRRFGEEEDDRFVGGIKYKLNETYEVFSSVGKAFDDGSSSNNLVSIIGIDFGFGKPKLPAKPKTDKNAP